MKNNLKSKLEDLARQLRELAIEYNEDYLTITYVNETLVGNNNPYKKDDKINVYLEKEKNE